MNMMPNGAAARPDPDKRIRNIVIVGGGAAGWMTAAALCVATRREPCRIVLVESEEIGTVGVGESTLPHIRDFNHFLGIDENEFVSATQATFKLAIQFADWRRPGHSYFNPLGAQGFSSESDGTRTKLPSLYQFLLKLAVAGENPNLDHYDLCSVAARHNRFDRAANAAEVLYSYAFQFDASLYANYLRRYSERQGAERIEGRIVDVALRGDNGFIDAVVLQSGQRVEGDLFIDCSGFRALLIGQTLKIPYLDWSHWLPCDRAWAVPSENTGPLTPYTRATAREAGWQWRIPLQHRMGNGYVYSSRFIGDDEARDSLLANLDGRPLAEPRLVKFTAGRRQEMWAKNCVAVGLSSGFIEPLESTSIHFIQNSVMTLLGYFPNRDCGALISAAYNRRIAGAFDAVRDFIIAHFHTTERDDTPFWRTCRTMSVPDSLALKLEMFRRHGRIAINAGDQGFGSRPWLTIMYNHGIVPEDYPALVAMPDDNAMRAELAKVRSGVQRTVERMPRHEDFIARNCSARPSSVHTAMAPG